MLSNKKNVFWQAFFVAVLIFAVGLVLGVYLEQLRNDEVVSNFFESEVSLYDSFAMGDLLDNSNISCDILEGTSVDFADKIYEEARQLERFDQSSKITDASKTLHRKYDLLRTIFWINQIELRKNCEGVDTVVYLYDYGSEDLSVISEQITWSRVLLELKEEQGGKMILLPIAADQDLSSLNVLLANFNISSTPAVLINEEKVFYDPVSSNELSDYLNN